MMRNQLLRIWGTLFLVPAIPTIAFYALFSSQNYFELQNAARGIVAAGPIAAYVALVIIGWNVYRNVSAITGDVSPLQKQVMGSWTFKATSYHGSAREGKCEIEEDHGRVCVAGNFEHGGKNVGRWTSTMATIEREQFEVLYRLDELREGQPTASTGVLSVHINPQNLREMTGNWVVLGRSEAHGEIILKRAKPR